MTGNTEFPRVEIGDGLVVRSRETAEAELARLCATIRDRKKEGLRASRLFVSDAEELADALARWRGISVEQVIADLEPALAAREGRYLVPSREVVDETAAEWAEAASPASVEWISRMTGPRHPKPGKPQPGRRRSAA